MCVGVECVMNLYNWTVSLGPMLVYVCAIAYTIVYSIPAIIHTLSGVCYFIDIFLLFAVICIRFTYVHTCITQHYVAKSIPFYIPVFLKRDSLVFCLFCRIWNRYKSTYPYPVSSEIVPYNH